MANRRTRLGAAVATAVALLGGTIGAACTADGDAGAGAEAAYRATIHRTSYGIPHVVADDWGSAGFGQAYAMAQDRGRILADQVLKVRGERAAFLGPGEGDANVTSDFAYAVFDVHGLAEAGFDDLPARERAMLEGYAAGYNAYLDEAGPEGFPGWCAGAEWIRPVSAVDVYAYLRDAVLYGSGASLAEYVGNAQPPGSPVDTTVVDQQSLADLPPPGSDLVEVHASNGWAFGADRTESGGGMVLTNPQFGWWGPSQFRENHLTIPGEVDVYGGSFGAMPGIQVGFNEAVAWTHTVAGNGRRFTVYSLDLVPGDPLSYRYDDEVRALEPVEVTIDVRRPDGSTEAVTRTLYRSHYGPVAEIPGVAEWTAEQAFTYRDANSDNDQAISQWLGMNTSTSMDEFQAVFAEVDGIPWVNTMAASADGRAWYVDASATPNLSADTIAGWREAVASDPLAGLLATQNVVLLDGSDSRNEWVDDPAASDPGLVPFAEKPQVERTDLVWNANQSHWIVNTATRLEGYSPMFGEEGWALLPRSVAVAQVEDTSPAGPAGADGRFTRAELLEMYFSNTSSTAERLLDQVVARCEGAAPVSVEGQTVDIGPACAALAVWDGRFDVDSRGALVWRELVTTSTSQTVNSTAEIGLPWAVPFDPADPLGTPRDLAPAPPEGPDPVLEKLARAVLVLQQAGFGPETPLGDAQWIEKGDERIPAGGGVWTDGVQNILTFEALFVSSLEPYPEPDRLSPSGLTVDGYRGDRGPAIVLAIELTEDGPVAEGIAAYSQSKDPDSPHFADQTAMFSVEEWRPVLFTEEDVLADPELETIEVSGG
ncbi:MAG: penicillin acylase family protein [Acidimicrobiales bacterium]|nr:penicillin acylase family protein [Acidimicrobiales bacterium]